MKAAFSGLDEAGYGPFLGPLVVAHARRRGGGEGDPWRSLASAVSSRRSRGDVRLLVCDSKLAYAPGRLAALERTVLAFLAADPEHGAPPRTLAELEAALGEHGNPEGAPWFDPRTRLPLAADPNGILEAAASLRAAFREAGVDSVRLRARAVDARGFNEGVRVLDSKAALLADVAACFIGSAEIGESLVIDRWGGRKDYREALARAFAGAGPCRIVSEDGADGDCAAYRVKRKGGELTVRFRTRADSSCFEVALASMTAKYLREVHMAAFNSWWCARVPGLRPTAGYPVDAGRWLEEAAPHFAALGVDRDEVWRCR